MKLFKYGDIVMFTDIALDGKPATVQTCEEGEYSEGLKAPLVAVKLEGNIYKVFCWRLKKVQVESGSYPNQLELNFNKGE